MVMTRLQKQNHAIIPETMAAIEADLNELKTGVQYVDASLYNATTGNSVDLYGWADGTNSSALTTTGSTLFLEIVVTVTSQNGKPLLSTLTPVLWLDTQSQQYIDTLTNYCLVSWGEQVSSDPTVVRYWLNVSTRGAQTVTSWWFKAYCYTSAPATISFTRAI